MDRMKGKCGKIVINMQRATTQLKEKLIEDEDDNLSDSGTSTSSSSVSPKMIRPPTFDDIPTLAGLLRWTRFSYIAIALLTLLGVVNITLYAQSSTRSTDTASGATVAKPAPGHLENSYGFFADNQPRNFYEAGRYCREKGGELVTVSVHEGYEKYQQLMAFSRHFMAQHGWPENHFWTGMTYSTNDWVVRLPNGIIGINHWAIDNPYSLLQNPDHENIGLLISMLGAAGNEGLTNEAPSLHIRPMCQRKSATAPIKGCHDPPCFFSVNHAMTYYEAENYCTESGAALAVTMTADSNHGDVKFNKMLSFARQFMEQNGWPDDHFWTGMVYHIDDKVVRTNTGQPGYTRWLAENPFALMESPAYTKVGLTVNEHGHSDHEGLVNDPGSLPLRPLCEKTSGTVNYAKDQCVGRDDCYFATNTAMNYHQAELYCKMNMGRLLEIPFNDGKQMYSSVAEFGRKFLSKHNWPDNHFWTGMKYNTEDKVARLSNGNAAYTHWHTDNPYTLTQYPDYTRVTLALDQDGKVTREGYLNDPASLPARPLCQKNRPSLAPASESQHCKGRNCLLFSNNTRLNFYEAHQFCVDNGGQLVTIATTDGPAKLKRVFAFGRQFMSSHGWPDNHFWTGMLYTHDDKVARLPDGSVGFVRWIPDNPYSLMFEPDFTNVGVIVHRTGTSHVEGMSNDSPALRLRPLCEK